MYCIAYHKYFEVALYSSILLLCGYCRLLALPFTTVANTIIVSVHHQDGGSGGGGGAGGGGGRAASVSSGGGGGGGGGGGMMDEMAKALARR